MNQVMLIGRLVRPVEVKSVGEHRVINNTLAVARKHRDRNGDYQADFIPISAWGRIATLMESYCAKGQQIAVSGKLQSRSYVNHLQQTVYVVECIVSELTLVDGGRKRTVTEEEEYKAVAEEYDVPLECPID